MVEEYGSGSRRVSMVSVKSCCDSLDSPGALWSCFGLDTFEGTAVYSGEKGRVDSKKGIT